MELGCSDIQSRLYWTPDSGRAYLPTATQILEFTKEERDFLGGWLAQASDRYARTARRKIVNMQRAVAREIPTRCPGRLAEEETSLTFHDFLKAKGFARSGAERLRETCGRLGQFFLRGTPRYRTWNHKRMEMETLVQCRSQNQCRSRER